MTSGRSARFRRRTETVTDRSFRASEPRNISSTGAPSDARETGTLSAPRQGLGAVRTRSPIRTRGPGIRMPCVLRRCAPAGRSSFTIVCVQTNFDRVVETAALDEAASGSIQRESAPPTLDVTSDGRPSMAFALEGATASCSRSSRSSTTASRRAPGPAPFGCADPDGRFQRIGASRVGPAHFRSLRR